MIIEVKNLSFAYDKQEIFKNLSDGNCIFTFHKLSAADKFPHIKSMTKLILPFREKKRDFHMYFIHFHKTYYN